MAIRDAEFTPVMENGKKYCWGRIINNFDYQGLCLMMDYLWPKFQQI